MHTTSQLQAQIQTADIGDHWGLTAKYQESAGCGYEAIPENVRTIFE